MASVELLKVLSGGQGPGPTAGALRRGALTLRLTKLRRGFQGSEVFILVQTPRLQRGGYIGADIGGQSQRGR